MLRIEIIKETLKNVSRRESLLIAPAKQNKIFRSCRDFLLIAKTIAEYSSWAKGRVFFAFQESFVYLYALCAKTHTYKVLAVSCFDNI